MIDEVPMHNLFIRIPKSVYKKLKFHAIEREVPMAQIIEEFVNSLPDFTESSCKSQ